MNAHRITKISQTFQPNDYCLAAIVMDCPVQPMKLVVTTRELSVGEIFDPHFSNSEVVARFPPTSEGWENAYRFVDIVMDPFHR